MKTGQWHVVGWVDVRSYVTNCLEHGWELVYDSDALVILKHVVDGKLYYNLLELDRNHSQQRSMLSVPANLTTLRQYLVERDGPEYARRVLLAVRGIGRGLRP